MPLWQPSVSWFIELIIVFLILHSFPQFFSSLHVNIHFVIIIVDHLKRKTDSQYGQDSRKTQGQGSISLEYHRVLFFFPSFTL